MKPKRIDDEKGRFRKNRKRPFLIKAGLLSRTERPVPEPLRRTDSSGDESARSARHAYGLTYGDFSALSRTIILVCSKNQLG